LPPLFIFAITLFRIPNYDAFRQVSTSECDGFVMKKGLGRCPTFDN
jgi:hypothetical protein